MDTKPLSTDIIRLDLDLFSGTEDELCALIREALDVQGCFIVENVFNNLTLESISDSINLALKTIGIYQTCHSRDVSTMLRKNKHMQSALYDQLISMPKKNDFFLGASSMQRVASCLFQEPILYEKSPLRVDVPFDLTEMTLWHQDYFYVRGNVDVLTFYIPLRDLDYLSGALSICLGSHKSGPLDHGLSWGKKSYPVDVGSFPSVHCELRAGSALVFNSLLLHQTNPNYSEFINYNIQYRVSDNRYLHSSQMGSLLPIPQPRAHSF
jgi:ectoine hydroxylase-related dioxygenase (phytanoyl-CoA dioxygenase family)